MEEKELNLTAEDEKKLHYKKIFTQQYDLIKRIKKICPSMDHQSGIYFYIRVDENGGKHAYIGKAVDLLKRTASHLRGWNQRIDGSLKKRGLYGKDNPYGWKLNFLHFPENKLDEKEHYYIKKYQVAGYEMYNIESGGNVGKEDINERKLGKGYYDGIERGIEKTRKEIAHWFDLHLEYSIKGKPTVNKQKAFDKFTKFLKGEDKNVQETKNDTV